MAAWPPVRGLLRGPVADRGLKLDQSLYRRGARGSL